MAERESVWDYPRPPRLEPAARHLRAEAGGRVIADTTRAFRVLETSHPPAYYIPPGDVATELLQPSPRSSVCEFKGRAQYFDIVLPDRTIPAAAWCYPEPWPGFEPIRGHLSFYAGKMDACFVDGERVAAQPGDFYGGWITADIAGPFKGGPGTMGW